MFTTKCTHHIFKSLPLSTASQLVFEYNVEKYKSADLSAVAIILQRFPQTSFVNLMFKKNQEKKMKLDSYLERPPLNWISNANET